MTDNPDASLAFCQFCGTKRIVAGQEYCAKCGQKLLQASDIQVAPVPEPSFVPPEAPPPPVVPSLASARRGVRRPSDPEQPPAPAWAPAAPPIPEQPPAPAWAPAALRSPSSRPPRRGRPAAPPIPEQPPAQAVGTHRRSRGSRRCSVPTPPPNRPAATPRVRGLHVPAGLWPAAAPGAWRDPQPIRHGPVLSGQWPRRVETRL